MRSESDCTSMKILLKQVYGIHTTKIKSLEDEIDLLKKNLQESELKLKNFDTECKRCVELEEAFNSCKAALHEQSKWFENLGQKFSALNTTEDKTFGKKDENIPSSNANNALSNADIPKMDISLSSKMHFLKNIMSLNPDTFQESLDLSTAPLKGNVHKEFSTLNADSLVLVPNTLDLSCEILDNCKPTDVGPLKPVNIESNCNGSKKLVTTVGTDQESDVKKSKSQKRSSDNSVPLEFFAEDFEEDSENQAYSFKKKLKSSVKITDNANVPVIQQTSKDVDNVKEIKSKTDIESSFHNVKKNAVQTLDIKIEKIGNNDSQNVTCKKASNENCNDVDISKDDFCQVIVSPSLLPLKERTNSKVVIKDEPLSAEDINDFQMTSVSKKTSNDSESWKSCDKKKLSKKTLNLPVVKSTSRFKIQLDSLPPNYKKPSYHQTKLSKSLFQAKPSCSNNLGTDSEEKLKNVETYLPQSSDMLSSSGAGKTPDFDATCIPDNYDYEAVSSEKPKKKNKPFGNSIMLVKDSSDESEEESSAEMIVEQSVATKDKGGGGKLSRKNNTKESPNELTNSFDRLPKKPEPDYKYKEETVRKKSERKQLTAFDCNECEKYYSELGLSEEEKQKRKNKCSRHRAKFAPPPTPKHFWELEFPDTQECKARGYLDETQKAKLKTHRKRPL